jgi:hypothetical protein
VSIWLQSANLFFGEVGVARSLLPEMCTLRRRAAASAEQAAQPVFVQDRSLSLRCKLCPLEDDCGAAHA